MTEADLQGKNAKFTTPKDLANACVAADQVIGI